VQQTEFTKYAAGISKGLYIVTQKLENLTKLAKSSTLFDDRNQEINELTYTIKNDITALQTQINDLEEWAQSHAKEKNKQSKENSKSIVQNLKVELANKTNNFKEILTLRTQNMKEQNSRRKQFENHQRPKSRKRNVTLFDDLDSTVIEEEVPEKSLTQRGNGAHLQQLDGPSHGGGSGGSPNSRQMVQTQTQMQVQMEQQVQDKDDYLVARQEAVESIEKTIVEIGEMYTQLSTMIHQQEELVLRIDDNMDTALENVDGGHKELIKYFNDKSNSTWLFVKIFGVVIFFVLLFLIKF